MKRKQVIAFVSAAALAVTSLAGCGKTEEKTEKTTVSEAEETAKEDLPLSKYPETVTVHLGGSMNPNAKLEDGKTYDDNVYLDLLKEDLNIDVEYDWVTSSSDYDEKMNLCIGSNTVPELMNVNATQYRALLKYDMIQPLDEYYEDYASDTLKGYVESGGEELRKCITNDKGEMMAIPAPSMMVGESSTDFYPLWNGYDNADEIEVSTETLEKYLAGEITMDDVDFSQHKLLKNDMEAVTELKKEPYDDFSLDKWNMDSDLAKSNLPRLVSLLVGGAPLVHDTYVPVYNAFSGQTETMETKWANLKKMEEETFAKIIMGKADISEFDTFVENWKKQGGDQILKEINEELGN